MILSVSFMQQTVALFEQALLSFEIQTPIHLSYHQAKGIHYKKGVQIMS